MGNHPTRFRGRQTHLACSRDIPFGFGWLIGPFVTSIPRESLNFTMSRARQALVK